MLEFVPKAMITPAIRKKGELGFVGFGWKRQAQGAKFISTSLAPMRRAYKLITTF